MARQYREEQTMYAPKHPEGSELKGGGFRGGPKRWTGRGPPPARHIPWPEIFKHHLSVVEGHMKMVDMVRKHTVPGSGNHRVINNLFERSQNMLYDTKEMTRNFVPPPTHREAVPIGSSSASMYPGYSPADHIYGEAAQEFGHQYAQAKKHGFQFEPGSALGVDYDVGMKTNLKRKAGEDEATSASAATLNGAMDPVTNGTPGVVAQPVVQESAKAAVETVVGSENPAKSSQPAFFIDTNPTPVNLPGMSIQLKNGQQQDDAETGGKRSKKKKTKHVGEGPKLVEFEDISNEVDKRLQEKEAKRKEKKEKKRKRESEASTTVDTAGAAADGEGTGKPKKKKGKKSKHDEIPDLDQRGANGDAVSPKKRSVEPESDEQSKKKKKRSRKA